MANATHRVKIGETGKKLAVTLKHTNSTTEKVEPYAIPDGSAVKLYMTLDGADTLKVNGATMTILNQTTYPGKCEYQWLSANIDTPEVYDLEIVLTLPDTTKLKWPCEDGETFATVIVMPSKTA
jgi:hypothetical protein